MRFWLSTPRATGIILTDPLGVVIGGCPYFNRAYFGKHLRGIIADLRAKHGREAIRWSEYDSPVTGA